MIEGFRFGIVRDKSFDEYIIVKKIMENILTRSKILESEL